MYQSRHIVFAFLILFIGAIVFFSLQYFYNARPTLTPVVITQDTASYLSLKRESGKALFYRSCASCHSLFNDMVGPALSGTIENNFWIDSTHIYDFIRHPENLEKFSYIRKLKEAYSNMGHPAFSSLTNNDVDNIIFYIKDAKRLQY